MLHFMLISRESDVDAFRIRSAGKRRVSQMLAPHS